MMIGDRETRHLAEDEARALRRTRFLLAAILALVALNSAGGVLSAALVVIAFVVGYLPASAALFLVDGIEARRRSGREVLHRLSDAEVRHILGLVRSGRKIEAIRELRLINQDGLREAKNAVELLDESGLDWRGSIGEPPR